jgi:hypothetical protein
LQAEHYFFTVTLADRRSRALVEHIGALRQTFRIARQERPFSVEAIVAPPLVVTPDRAARSAVA